MSYFSTKIHSYVYEGPRCRGTSLRLFSLLYVEGKGEVFPEYRVSLSPMNYRTEDYLNVTPQLSLFFFCLIGSRCWSRFRTLKYTERRSSGLLFRSRWVRRTFLKPVRGSRCWRYRVSSLTEELLGRDPRLPRNVNTHQDLVSFLLPVICYPDESRR